MNPLLIFKTIGVSVGLGGGITGSIFSSFQAFTRVTIEDLLKDDLFTAIDSSKDKVWKFLKGKLDSSENQNEKILEETKLKDAKKPEDGTSETGNENGQKLNNWCKKIKDTKIKKFLSSNYETILLDYVKSFCIISIGEKLTSASQFTDSTSDITLLKTKTAGLSNHNDGNGNLSLEKELESIKSKDSEKEKALLSWCLSSYKKSYKGSSDNLWKLANYYCKKTS